MPTSQEGKHWILMSYTPLKNWLCVASCTWRRGWVNAHTHTHTHTYIYIYIYHHQVLLILQTPLTVSLSLSLSLYHHHHHSLSASALRKSSKREQVSTQSWWMLVFTGKPTIYLYKEEEYTCLSIWVLNYVTIFHGIIRIKEKLFYFIWGWSLPDLNRRFKLVTTVIWCT